MNTNIDFRYTFISPKAIRMSQHGTRPNNLLERVIRQVEHDIKIIEERLEIYREFDKISQL